MEREPKKLNHLEPSWNFDLSDIKNDRTQYLDKTPHRSGPNSPFEPREISARSTHINPLSSHLDFDEIMKSSCSEAVRNKYRESLYSARSSNFSKTTNTYRVSINNKTTTIPAQKDFWEDMNPSFSSFSGKNFTYNNEEFIPAEKMTSKLDEDEKMQDMEYGVIPHVSKVQEDTINWDSNPQRQPEMSFGQFCMDRVKQNNIREVFNAASPPKRHDRVPLVEMTGNDSAMIVDGDKFEMQNLEKIIKKCDESQAKKLLFKKPQTSSSTTKPSTAQYSSSVARMMQELNVDRLREMTEKEKQNKENIYDNIPVHDDDLHRFRNELYGPENRGLKRRPSLAPNETPKSALEKCLRSRSPTNQKEMEMAAALLKPKIIKDDDLFKRPLPSDSTILKSCLKSPTLRETTSESQLSGREYVTAMQSLSLRSKDAEKLSLPNYSLQRPVTSPTSSVRSMNSQWSPDGTKLRRSASQLSTDSEFSDDFLPIKIKNVADNRKISFPSVKIDKSVTTSISIQNGSDKKLPLRVKIIGAGFSVIPREEFRMVPMEARTFTVKFQPSVIGPACGCLVFELITNKTCSKSIPLYGYGGHANVSIENVQKGPFGPAFVTMGTVKDLTGLIERNLRLINKGTLASFVTVAFERTKLSDFVLSNSISVEPTHMRIEPGRSIDVRIKFKATKSEIRKILSINKDVMTIAEICVISGDEPTRLRILRHKHFVEPKFMEYLPLVLPNEAEVQIKLQKFREDMSRDKLMEIMRGIRTQEIALTINRNLEDTILLSTEMSLVDDMSFETFVDQTNVPFAIESAMDGDPDESIEFLESKYFRITPSEIIFKRSIDTPDTKKVIRIDSLSNELLYIEAVPSNHKLVSALRPCGKLNARESCEVKVSATQRALESPNYLTAFIVLIIRDARLEIPVKIVD